MKKKITTAAEENRDDDGSYCGAINNDDDDNNSMRRRRRRSLLLPVLAAAAAFFTVARCLRIGETQMRLRRTDSNQNNNSESNREVEIDSFFYIHAPKTGTSLFTVLRNRLKSCEVKDFTCFGYDGGGVWSNMARDGKVHYPFDAKRMGLGRSRKTSAKVGTCENTLNCPPYRALFHCPYATEACRRQRNKVTMFRDPHKWFRSAFEWFWLSAMTNETVPIVRNRRFNVDESMSDQSPMAFATGKSTPEETEEAFEIVSRDYLWWGVTDHWRASVCVFHCELGGEERPSETDNVRSSSANEWMIKPDELETTILSKEQHRSSYVSNYTKYVEETYPGEIAFYHTKIMPEFRRRALACGCDL